MTITSTSWRNWAGDEGCTPARIFAPQSVTELAEAVAKASADGQTVRVVGAGHSFGDLVCTDGLLLNIDALRGVRDVDYDAGLITVGAGTRLADLNAELARLGLALPNLGDIDRQSVAGAVSTGTHGTGARLGNLAVGIVGAEMVLADGSILALTDDDPETLRAARVSLGALGVITSYRLRVVPAFRLHAQQRSMPMAEVLGRLDELVDDNDHFEFFQFPHADSALVKMNNRTDLPARPRSDRAKRLGSFVENGLLDAVCRVGRRFPAQIPRINRGVDRLMTASDAVDASYEVFASPRTVRFTESEWAVPREACAQVLTDIHRAIDKHRIEVNFPIEVRFVAGDTASYLSPACGRDTAYLAVHMYRGMAWRPYFQAVQDIAVAHGGRPHWGKRHLLDAERLADLYPEWGRFQAVRSRVDPTGTFTNDHIRRVLGSVGA
ncbi:FAD-binding protein [Gordonia sp. TBRC 11910]|uniref:FAD-binding protein n=1 Tax=Gordonia asplenii TaxID=2725283 RepID=A0A848KX60_9ACTN|nr:D-arabinono-1,4-lactone oxidase [Gordonia asplenii]NMO02909.1 FAD-binding protein [Gordonia asplenii]